MLWVFSGRYTNQDRTKASASDGTYVPEPWEDESGGAIQVPARTPALNGRCFVAIRFPLLKPTKSRFLFQRNLSEGFSSSSVLSTIGVSKETNFPLDNTVGRRRSRDRAALSRGRERRMLDRLVAGYVLPSRS